MGKNGPKQASKSFMFFMELLFTKESDAYATPKSSAAATGDASPKKKRGAKPKKSGCC